MAKIKQLERYTAASIAVRDFKEKNEKVFDKFDALLVEAGEAEAELKEHIKSKVKDNVQNDFIKVTYSQSFSKYYDAEVVLSLVTPKAKAALTNAGAIITKIDGTILEELVEKGMVPVEVRQEAFREVEGSPRVSIKEVK